MKTLKNYINEWKIDNKTKKTIKKEKPQKTYFKQEEFEKYLTKAGLCVTDIYSTGLLYIYDKKYKRIRNYSKIPMVVLDPCEEGFTSYLDDINDNVITMSQEEFDGSGTIIDRKELDASELEIAKNKIYDDDGNQYPVYAYSKHNCDTLAKLIKSV